MVYNPELEKEKKEVADKIVNILNDIFNKYNIDKMYVKEVLVQSIFEDVLDKMNLELQVIDPYED